MNILGKRLRMMIFAAVMALFVFLGIALVRESPRFVTAKISEVVIGKDFLTDFTHYIRLSGSDFTCQPDDGKQWVCQVMLEGKSLEMTASYMLSPYQSLIGCTVVYDGKARECQFTLGYGWQANLLVNDNLGISEARMAELRARNPLLYMDESTWLSLGVVASVVLVGLIMSFLLARLDKKPVIKLPVQGFELPVWAFCLVVVLLAVAVNRILGLMFVLPLGMGGTIILAAIIVWLNKRDKKRPPAFVGTLTWAAVSLIVFWVINFGTVFGLLALGFVD